MEPAAMIAEGLALIDKAMRHRRPGPYQIQARRRRAACRSKARRRTPTGPRSICSTPTSSATALARGDAQLRGRRLARSRGPEAALEMLEPLGDRLQGYFYFHGVKGALLEQLDATRRGPRGLRPRDRTRQYPGRGRAYPPAFRIGCPVGVPRGSSCFEEQRRILTFVRG